MKEVTQAEFELASYVRQVLEDTVEFLKEQEISTYDCLNIMFRLLLIKQRSDVINQETVDEKRKEVQPKNSSLPSKSDWLYLQNHQDRTGQEIAQKLEEIAKHIPVFSLQPLSKSAKFNWDEQPEAALSWVISYFSSINFDEQPFSCALILGQVIEEILEEKLIGEPKIKEKLIPPSVAKLMVRLLNPQPTWHLCDPFCGWGRLLVEALRYLKETEKHLLEFHVYGQEKSSEIWLLSSLYFALQNYPFEGLFEGDALREPQLLSYEQLKRFDGVIPVLPLQQGRWGEKEARLDRYERFPYGIPAESTGEWAYIQHVLATLKDTGVAVVVTTHGALFRESESEIRRKIVEADLLEAVISLPLNLFYHTRRQTVILIFRRPKTHHQKQVLFIEASNLFVKGWSFNVLSEENIAQIVQAYESFQDSEEFARVVNQTEIAKQGYFLNIKRYLAPSFSTASLMVEIEELLILEKEREQAEQTMEDCLRQFGISLERD